MNNQQFDTLITLLKEIIQQNNESNTRAELARKELIGLETQILTVSEQQRQFIRDTSSAATDTYNLLKHTFESIQKVELYLEQLTAQEDEDSDEGY